MPPRTAKPVQVLTEEHKRAQRIFARLVGGESNRLAPDRLRLKAAFQRVGDEVDKMEDRLARLDAAREALSPKAGGKRSARAWRERGETKSASSA